MRARGACEHAHVQVKWAVHCRSEVVNLAMVTWHGSMDADGLSTGLAPFGLATVAACEGRNTSAWPSGRVSLVPRAAHPAFPLLQLQPPPRIPKRAFVPRLRGKAPPQHPPVLRRVLLGLRSLLRHRRISTHHACSRIVSDPQRRLRCVALQARRLALPQGLQAAPAARVRPWVACRGGGRARLAARDCLTRTCSSTPRHSRRPLNSSCAYGPSPRRAFGQRHGGRCGLLRRLEV